LQGGDRRVMHALTLCQSHVVAVTGGDAAHML
jgi:hypothetical protein